MAAGVWGVSLLPLGDLASLIAQVVCGVAIYLGLAVLCKLQSLDYLVRSMKEFFQKKRQGEPAERQE